jgi:hypothetical protein
MSQRPEGICADPTGKCGVRGKKVTLFGGFCRKCYDRLRNSDSTKRGEMPEIPLEYPTGEERELQSSRTKLFEVFRELTFTPEDIATAMETFGPYFRPLQAILEREKFALDVLFTHVPPIVEPQPQPQQASTDSTDSTAKKSRLLSRQLAAGAAGDQGGPR